MAADTEHALIAATLGFTTMEVVKLWRDAAPTLEEMRRAAPDDTTIRQRMSDANFLGAGMALIMGGSVSWLMESWIPMILTLGLVAFMAFWYRQVLASDESIMEETYNG